MHHGPHPSHLRVGVPLLPTQTELVGPVSLSWPSLSVLNCPSAHLTLPMGFSFPLLHPCTLRALKAKIYSLLCSAKLPLGHFPIPFWGHSVTTSPARGVVSSPSRVSSSLPRGQRWEALTGHLQESLHSVRRHGTPESLLEWPDLGVCPGLLQGAERQLCAFFGTTHFSVCHRTSHSTMIPVLWCRQRRGPFTKPGLCRALCTTACWPICHYLHNGPHCAFAGLDKVPCVCACMHRGAKDTPGGPRAPGPRAWVPLMALSSGQPHLTHQGHRANKGHPLSLLFWNEISEEKALIWLLHLAAQF